MRDEWKGIDEVLAGMKLQRLKVIVDARHAWSDIQDLDMFMEELLPRLRDRGILQVLAGPSAKEYYTE